MLVDRRSIKSPHCVRQVNKIWRVEDKFGSWNKVQKRFFGDKVRLAGKNLSTDAVM